MEKIKIYCDGACRGNGKETNIGAYAAILMYEDITKELYEVEYNTSNNVMELKGALTSLKLVNDKTIPVEIYSDSAYVVDGINEWIHNWIKRGWLTSTKKPVENKRLWEELYKRKNEFSDIQFIKVKGHSDNKYNNRADKLCNMAMDIHMK